EGRKVEAMPPSLDKPLARLYYARPSNIPILSLRVRLGSKPAYADAIHFLQGGSKLGDPEYVSLMALLGEVGSPDVIEPVARFLHSANPVLQTAALGALQAFKDPAVAKAILAEWQNLKGPQRQRAVSLLTARQDSSKELLLAVDAGSIKPAEIAIPDLQRISAFEQADLNTLLQKHWGKVGSPTVGEKRAQISSIRNIVSKGRGEG